MLGGDELLEEIQGVVSLLIGFSIFIVFASLTLHFCRFIFLRLRTCNIYTASIAAMAVVTKRGVAIKTVHTMNVKQRFLMQQLVSVAVCSLM